MNRSTSSLLIALLFTPGAFAASSIQLAIQGAITPNACEPTLSAGGMVDFGKMSAKSLNESAYTNLPPQTMRFSVRCEGPTFFTLNTIDNRAGTSANHETWHGLGMTPNNEKLGGTGFGLYSSIADGLPATTITSEDGGITWKPSVLLTHSMLTAVTRGSDLTPIAIKDYDAQIRLVTHIAPSEHLTLTDEVPVDGHATVQLNYL